VSGITAIAGTQLIAGVSAAPGSHDAARTPVDDLPHIDICWGMIGLRDRVPSLALSYVRGGQKKSHHLGGFAALSRGGPGKAENHNQVFTRKREQRIADVVHEVRFSMQGNQDHKHQHLRVKACCLFNGHSPQHRGSGVLVMSGLIRWRGQSMPVPYILLPGIGRTADFVQPVDIIRAAQADPVHDLVFGRAQAAEPHAPFVQLRHEVFILDQLLQHVQARIIVAPCG
jgi:hypothetical protein